jgi:hypothetical protein
LWILAVYIKVLFLSPKVSSSQGLNGIRGAVNLSINGFQGGKSGDAYNMLRYRPAVNVAALRYLTARISWAALTALSDHGELCDE